MNKQNETPLQALSKENVADKLEKFDNLVRSAFGMKTKETGLEKKARIDSELAAKQERTDKRKAERKKAIEAGPQRTFDGEIRVGNAYSEEERHVRAYDQRMLKAYLRGGKLFDFGFREVKTKFGSVIRMPEPHIVESTDKTINAKAVQELFNSGITAPGCELVSRTPGAKRTSHAEIKDRKFQKEEDEREKEVEAFNKEIKALNKGKKKADKQPLLVFTRRQFRPGSKAYLASKLGL